MSQIGHEAPLKDNKDSADMSSHAGDEAQLRIGDPVPEEEVNDDQTLGLPPHLQLTSREMLLFQNKVDVLGRDSAILQVVPRSKARQIIGYWESHKIDDKLGDSLAESRAKATGSSGPSAGELVELFRDIHKPRLGDNPPEAADKVA